MDIKFLGPFLEFLATPKVLIALFIIQSVRNFMLAKELKRYKQGG